MLPAKITSKPVAKSTLARALSRFKTESKQRARPSVRIGFLIDATASRAQTWVHAQKIQAQMFASVSGIGAMALRLVHFGGGAVIDHGWMSSPTEIATAMNKVECVTGLTMFLPGLRCFLEEGELPDAVILVGDTFEEDTEVAAALARVLKDAGVKVFSFLEGSDETAARTFLHLAQTTGGKFTSFGTQLPLRDLCEGVALLTAGGQTALKRLENKKVQRLLLTGPSNK
jgi:hypothetical protein